MGLGKRGEGREEEKSQGGREGQLAMEWECEEEHNLAPPLQELEERCSEGQALLASVLTSRERVIPWGLPQIEDRALETVQQDWRAYRSRLAEARTQHTGTLNRLRQMEYQFQRLEQWLTDMEAKGQPRTHRQSDQSTKEEQLQMFKVGDLGWLAAGGSEDQA